MTADNRQWDYDLLKNAIRWLHRDAYSYEPLVARHLLHAIDFIEYNMKASGPPEEGSSPSDGELTPIEAAVLTLWEEIAKLRERVRKLEEENL